MLRDSLQNAQSIVSAGLLGEGVRVVFDATTPYADLTNRVMHLRPLPEEVSAEALLHLRADCDHEMGHFAFTSARALEGITRPIVKLIANAIEDGVIERKVSDRWFGCAQNLAASNAQIRAELREKLNEPVNGLRALAINGLQMLAFGNTLDEVYTAFGDEIAALYEPVADLIPRLSLIANTHETVAIAAEFADRWRWGRTEPPSASGEDGLASQPRRPDSEWHREDAVARRLSDDLVGSARKVSIAEESFVDHYRYRPYTDEDRIEPLQPSADSAAATAFVAGVRHVVPALRRRLVMEFSGIGQRYQRNCRRGELDQRALHKVRLGSDRIFRAKVPEIVLDADVTLLVDASGSMGGAVGTSGRSQLYVAAQAACAFSMVLDLLHVPHECVAFTTAVKFGQQAGRGWAERYERVRPLRHIIVKPAARTFRQCRSHFASLAELRPLVENCDGEAVMWAAQRLATRSRVGMKPILIAFSDGSPQSEPEDSTVLNTHLKRVIERVEAAGITCVGIGIASAAVAKFYRNHAVIDDVNDLVKTSYEVVRTALRAARRRA